MRKIIVILLAIVLATVLLLTACGKKAEKPNESEPTPSESETMPTESETAPTESETTPRESDTTPSESESDTVQATELDHHIEMYDENDVVYAKELTPVKRVENPTYRIEGYYSTPSEAFAGHPIVHGYENLDIKPWNLDTHSYCTEMVVSLPLSKEFFPDDFIADYGTESNGVIPKTDEERKYFDHVGPDSVVFKDDFKIPSSFALETDEQVGILAELLATTGGESVDNIDYYITKVFAHGKLIDISDYISGTRYLMNAGRVFYFQGNSVYFKINGGRMKITEDDVSFTEGYWGYFYDDECNQIDVFDEYGQRIYWGFHPGKVSKEFFSHIKYPDDITLPYWD